MTLTGRGLATEALSETGHVVGRGSATSDSGGGVTFGTATASADVPCRIDALGGREGLAAGRVSDRSTHTITLPAGTEISPASDFAVDGRGTYEVTAVREHSDELTRVVEAVSQT